MARIPSTMVPLGTAAPPFHLPEADGGRFGLEDVRGPKGLLIMFICNHCPFVKHVREELARIGREYPSRGVGVAAIMPNDVAKYPDDSPERMAEEKRNFGYAFPYLYDESQEVAEAYGAACTPDFFLYGPELALYYRGQLDDSRPDNGKPVTGADLRAALEALIAGAPAPEAQKPSLGCNVKWKPGKGPA